jgi:hypothetical protein
MKYKLINRITKEEHICVELTINEFNYYLTTVSQITDGYILNKTNIEKYSKDDQKYEKYHKIIATNNSNIDIPQVIDNVEKLAYNFIKAHLKRSSQAVGVLVGYMEGYKESQKIYSFSEEDMIEFGDWLENVCNNDWKLNKECFIISVASVAIRNIKELLDIWKEQQLKTIYYE